jgi:hypothetical protein
MRISPKSGQAMIEFLVGLVGVVILLLGLELIANIVYQDVDTIFQARIDVAEDMVAGSTQNTGASSAYDPSASYDELDININSSGEYEMYQSDYPQTERGDGFQFLRENGDPLETMVGAEKGDSIGIPSQLMRQILGRSDVQIENSVWMPQWDGLQ